MLPPRKTAQIAAGGMNGYILTGSNVGLRQSLHTLKNIILSWFDDSVCYPGHGPSFRLGGIRPLVEKFITKDHDDFFGDAEMEYVAR